MAVTPPKFNIAPEKWWLEDKPFLLGFGNFSGAFTVKLREGNDPLVRPWFFFWWGGWAGWHYPLRFPMKLHHFMTIPTPPVPIPTTKTKVLIPHRPKLRFEKDLLGQVALVLFFCWMTSQGCGQKSMGSERANFPQFLLDDLQGPIMVQWKGVWPIGSLPFEFFRAIFHWNPWLWEKGTVIPVNLRET